MSEKDADAEKVRIVDIQMPFTSMVGFMIKWVLATIPAAIILIFIVAVLSSFFGGFLGYRATLP